MLNCSSVVIKTYFIGVYFANVILDYLQQISLNKYHMYCTQTNSVISRTHSLVKSVSVHMNPNSISSQTTISSVLPRASAFSHSSSGNRYGYWQCILWFCIVL